MSASINSGDFKINFVHGNGTALGLGRTVVPVGGNTDVTPSNTQYSEKHHELTGALTGNINYIVPAVAGSEWVINNLTTGAFTLTVKTAAGTGVVIGTNKTAIVRGDGTNIVRVTADV